MALQYWFGFCHTSSTWITHRYTYVPSLPHPTLPHTSKLLQSPSLSSLSHIANEIICDFDYVWSLKERRLSRFWNSFGTWPGCYWDIPGIFKSEAVVTTVALSGHLGPAAFLLREVRVSCWLEKKMHDLKTENYVLPSRQNWGLEPRMQPLRQLLRDCSEEIKEEPGYIGVLQQRPGSQNIKISLLVKENQVSQIKEFSASLLYMWEDAKVWAQWNHSFAMHLSHLGPVFCFSPSWVPSGCTPGSSISGWELDGHSIHRLLIWQATLFIHKWYSTYIGQGPMLGTWDTFK